MGAYSSAVITNSGQNMITQAIANRQILNFSSVKISSYAYPEGTNIAGLTDLQDIKQSQQPSAAEIFNETMIQVSARFGNEDVSVSYLIETIGIYAKLGEGEETLFSVIQATTPDQMPVSSDVSPSAFIYVMQITVQQASQIRVTVNPAGTATVQDIENLKTYVINNFIGTSGDISNTIAEFEEPEELQELVSGENVSSVFGKLKLAVKNLKTLITLIGATDISSIGGGTVTGAISALNSNLSKRKIESSFTSLHFFKFEEKIELGEYPYNKTAVYGLHSLSQFLTTEASERYLGYVIESFPTEIMIPFVIPCLLSTQDFSVTQVSSIYIKSDGGVYLSVPSALKSTVFNSIFVNSVYWGYYGR